MAEPGIEKSLSSTSGYSRSKRLLGVELAFGWALGPWAADSHAPDERRRFFQFDRRKHCQLAHVTMCERILE
ncbi:hypothetical protein Y032_0032g2569 [Ancylostoma ceylanicum]|nr:hypothetical protein Y032_0032g2569 [Ancylostoma ceylanicum]